MASGISEQEHESVNHLPTDGKIRVMRVIARLNIGGPAIHTVLLAHYMQPLGYETLLVAGKVGAGEGDMGYLADSLGVKPVIIPQLGRIRWPLDDLIAFFRILHLLFRFRPHIVHTHTAKAGTLGRLAAFIYNRVQSSKLKAQSCIQVISQGRAAGVQPGIPKGQCTVVHTFHGHILRGYFSHFTSKLIQVVEKTLAMITDTVVVVSVRQKEELSKHFCIGRPGQYHVIPLGFDLNAFSGCSMERGQFRVQLGLPQKNAPLVGIVGRLTPIKNHRLFLEAAKSVLSPTGENKTRFVMVGDGELRRDLKSLAQQFELEDRVIFAGWVKDMVPVYADLDVLALTSNNEGTPVTVIEAMAAGVPVIATDVGGVKGLISDFGFRISESKDLGFEVCERGVLVKRGDVEGFAKGLQYLLEQPDLRRQMGQRGREYALKHHSKERLVADLNRLYISLLQ